MNKEKQRIAIAEATGWTYIDNDPERYPYWLAPKGDWRYGSPLDANMFPDVFPNYLNDLNAMHEAEKVLREPDQVVSYMEWLGMCYDDSGYKTWRYVAATAAQRAEAFLRTIGKWEDDK
jgi:hypothetical protein